MGREPDLCQAEVRWLMGAWIWRSLWSEKVWISARLWRSFCVLLFYHTFVGSDKFGTVSRSFRSFYMLGFEKSRLPSCDLTCHGPSRQTRIACCMYPATAMTTSLCLPETNTTLSPSWMATPIAPPKQFSKNLANWAMMSAWENSRAIGKLRDTW